MEPQRGAPAHSVWTYAADISLPHALLPALMYAQADIYRLHLLAVFNFASDGILSYMCLVA